MYLIVALGYYQKGRILLKNNFTRQDCIISLGGGITGDLSGFDSSINKRRIKFNFQRDLPKAIKTT